MGLERSMSCSWTSMCPPRTNLDKQTNNIYIYETYPGCLSVCLILKIRQISYRAASMPNVFSISAVLLDVVAVPFTPLVAMTACRLSPSTKSLYFCTPPFSSMVITALDTEGIPCKTIKDSEK